MYLTRVSARSGTTLTMQFRVTVPLLKPPSFQPSNLDTENLVHWNQTSRLEQCAARTRFPPPRCSAGSRFTLRAPYGVELARFRLAIVYACI